MQTVNINILEVIHSLGSLKLKMIKLLDLTFGLLLTFLVKEKKNVSQKGLKYDQILIIRPGGIGDAIFLIPFLRKLKKFNKTASVDILCEKRNSAVFSSQKDMGDNIYCYDVPQSFLSLFKNQYDVIVDTEQWHYLSALISYFVKHKTNMGFGTRFNRAKLFNYKVNYEINSYEIENFKRLFLPILPECQEIENINDCFHIDSQTLIWADQTMIHPYITVFLGASIAVRRLDRIQSLELIRFILNRNFSIAVLGGKDVQQYAREILHGIKDNRVFNFVGKISLMESAALIKKSKLFVGPDSGLMHLACAVGTPVIGIFGPGNLKKWEPIGKNHSVITENVECSPCTLFGYTIPTCQGSFHCMRNIKLEKIFSAIKKKINSNYEYPEGEVKIV